MTLQNLKQMTQKTCQQHNQCHGIITKVLLQLTKFITSAKNIFHVAVISTKFLKQSIRIWGRARSKLKNPFSLLCERINCDSQKNHHVESYMNANNLSPCGIFAEIFATEIFHKMMTNVQQLANTVGNNICSSNASLRHTCPTLTGPQQ